MVSRHYIVGAVVIVLLMWGPLDHDSPWGLAIRLGYLVLVPLIVWVGLMWLWRRWKPDEASEDRLQRTLEGMASGVMLGGLMRTGHARRPPFEDDPHQVADELQRLVDGGMQRFYLGHGGPLPANEVLRHAQVLRGLPKRALGHCCAQH